MIDIGELIRSQQSDKNAHVIPDSTHQGSLELSPVGDDPSDMMTAVLSSGIYNPQKATWGYGCEVCSGVVSWRLKPVPLSIPYSRSTQSIFTYTLQSGQEYDVTSSSSWSSSNTSVASVQTSGQTTPGLTTGVGLGSTNVHAQYSQTLPINTGQICGPAGSLPACPTMSSFPADLSEETTCNATVSTEVVNAQSCQGQLNTSQLSATITPDTDACYLDSAHSSCAIGNPTGEVDPYGNCNFNGSYHTAQGTVSYFAGTAPPWPGSGSVVGTFDAQFSLQLQADHPPVVAQRTISVQCP